MEYILNEKNDKKITLKKFQNELLSMMTDIDKICVKNNIKYILYGSSVLGAVCYKGFRSCDDNISIAMTRDNYYKLIKALEHNSDYTAQSYELDKRYLVTGPTMKIRKLNTYVEEKNIFLNNKCSDCDGIYINVFIISNISRSKLIDFIVRYLNAFIALVIITFELVEINSTLLKRLYKWNSKMYDKLNKKSNYIGEDITNFKSILKLNSYKYDDIFPSVKKKFCNTKFPIPHNSEKYLLKYFGYNYMDNLTENKKDFIHIKNVDLNITTEQQIKYIEVKKRKKLLKQIILFGLCLIIFSTILLAEFSFLLAGIGIMILGVALMILFNTKN